MSADSTIGENGIIPARIKVKRCTEDKRTYYFTKVISNHQRLTFFRPFDRATTKKETKKSGELGEKLLETLFCLEGTTTIQIEPYEVTITKSDAFDWREIEPLALQVMKLRVYGEEADITVSGDVATIGDLS